MSYHNTTPAAARQSTTNTQSQAAPAGYHYMPDGSLMADIDHASLYGSKIIKSFSLDTSNIKAAGERRRFTVLGDKGATFSLEIREGVNYYNFDTGLFQTAQTKLANTTIGTNSYRGSISFPKVAAGAQYDIYLFTENGTKHAEYNEVRLPDNRIDINSTTGSNSNLIQKVIYQTLDVTLTLQGFSPNATITAIGSDSQVITTSRNASVGIIPFSFIVTTGTSNTLAITKQPVNSDIMAFLTLTPLLPIDIEGENIYPAVTSADKVVNGIVEGGATNVTMDDNVGTFPNNLWAVGDRITGNAALDARGADVVTITAINVGSNAKIFTMSEAIDIADDETLSFSNRRNYRWSLNNIHGLTAGMRQLKGSFFGGVAPTIKEYLVQTTVNEGQADEYKVDNVRIPALDTLGVLPVTTRNGTTKVETTVQTGNVTFSEQALALFSSGSNAKIHSYGESEINRLTGYDVEFTDLKVVLTPVTTTTTAAPDNNTSVVITNRIGISDNISTVSGIGIDSSVANPTVASGAGSVTGAGTIVLSAAQTLESGITLTFSGAGSVATITGNIKVNKAGNENVILRFDLEKFLTMQ